MADLRLTVDGSPHVVAAGTPIGDVFRDLAISRAVAARGPAGARRDLAGPRADGDVGESVPPASPEGLSIARHSPAHVLARAVQRPFPSARLGIGPPIDNGFYYDFDVDRPFTPEDLELLEAT